MPQAIPRFSIFGSQEFQKAEANYTESNQTDFIYTALSILPSGFQPETGLIDSSSVGEKLMKLFAMSVYVNDLPRMM